eukprot:COSAG01_NODE_2624_length_7358_cov_4.679019_7_plen_200_part_00
MQVASAAACGENSSGSRNSPSVLLQQQQQQQQQQATAGAANAELPPPLRVLEFFSGVGGWHMALAASSLRANVVGAFELNPNANTVYAHNFAPLSPRCVPAPPHHHPAACFCPRRRLTAPPPGACVASARRVAGGRGLNIEKLPTRELDSYRAVEGPDRCSGALSGASLPALPASCSYIHGCHMEWTAVLAGGPSMQLP